MAPTGPAYTHTCNLKILTYRIAFLHEQERHMHILIQKNPQKVKCLTTVHTSQGFRAAGIPKLGLNYWFRQPRNVTHAYFKCAAAMLFTIKITKLYKNINFYITLQNRHSLSLKELLSFLICQNTISVLYLPKYNSKCYSYQNAQLHF